VPPLIKTIVAVGAAAASAALGLSRLQIPKDFWGGKPGWLVACVVYLAAWSVYETFDRGFAARRAKREKRRIAMRREAEQILKGVLVNVSQATSLDWTRIGVHLFLVETRWRWWPWPFRYEVQARAVKVKMSEYPPSTGITWTKGKGVIGRCWAKQILVGKDLRATYARYRVTSRGDWDRLGPAVRFGLTYDEFVNTREHAGTVLAAPVREPGGAYLGCVSLDAPGDCFSVLNTHPIKERLQAAACYIAPRVAKSAYE
jgi:hypothetical protein